jgi:hypothetical protein
MQTTDQSSADTINDPSRRPSPTPTVTSTMPSGKTRNGDVERAAETGSGSTESGSGSTEKDGSEFIVKWDGPDDPGCPLNTPLWKKW